MVEATAKGPSSPRYGRAEERTRVRGWIGVERAVVRVGRRGHSGVLVDGEADGTGAGGHDVLDVVNGDEGRADSVGGGVDAVCVERRACWGIWTRRWVYKRGRRSRLPRPCESQPKPLLRSPVRSHPRDTSAAYSAPRHIPLSRLPPTPAIPDPELALLLTSLH